MPGEEGGTPAGRALTAAPTANVRPMRYGIATTTWPVSGWKATRLPRATITFAGDRRSTVNELRSRRTAA